MRISADFTDINQASDYILSLERQTIQIGYTLQGSLGRATEKERAIIMLLSQICMETFPRMLESSRELLSSIIRDFSNADRVSSSFGGTTGEPIGSMIDKVINSGRNDVE